MITAKKPWEESWIYRCLCGEEHRHCDPCPYGDPEIEKIDLGIKARFIRDGHVATLTIDGWHCTCRARSMCSHVRLAVPAYGERKLQLARENVGRWGATMYRQLGLDPADFGVI